MKDVHILNGDSLKSHWPKPITGELIVARECLIDGNVQAENLEMFFANRAKFISSYGDITEESYYQKTVTEFNKILQIPKGCKTYCWFEHDLFCQVNFWFVISLLIDKCVVNEIYFVEPNEGNEYSFAHMREDELIAAYNNARLISSDDLKQLSRLWTLYQRATLTTDCTEMFEVASPLSCNFPFLPEVIKAQQDRSPDRSGYGRPERRLLEIMKEDHTLDFGLVFTKFCQTEGVYSFGDLQVKQMFDRLLLESIKK